MIKSEFLRKLEKKLIILSEEERKDILSEYESIIDEKVLNGKDENVAISEFGNINTLADEILKTYKLNSNYTKKDEDLEDALTYINNGIKKIAKILSDFTTETITKIKKENKNITVENIFEIIIKIVIALFVLTLLFNLLQVFALFVSEVISFGILRPLIKFIWQLVIAIIFIFIAFLVSYNIVNETLKKDEPKTIKKESNKTEKKTIEKELIKGEASNKIYDIFMVIVKIFVFIWSLPLMAMLFGSYLGLISSLFLILKGIMIFGILLLSIGSIIFFSHLLNLIYSAIFKGKILKLYPFLISIVFIFVGSLLTVDFFLGLKNIPLNRYVLEDETFIYTDIERIYLSTDDYYLNEKEDWMDLDKGEIQVTIRSHQKFVNIYQNTYQITESKSKFLTINRDFDYRALYNEFMKNLSKNEIYDMFYLRKYSVIIHADSETLEKLKVVFNY